ncbi:hypothetical protein SLU01_11760 [Sporosarcina luteola]|uniref:RanBP2-type domain-containing protein n=1 Tax=Sporosarcina luteola TaxID=582850 RepID=A0A511Z601_9BACL|nr:hypothetical protein [Sporosarcina luteola]GEN82864.1 hypothetical protein SLU01_11760 [Sporosarcina luteola]
MADFFYAVILVVMLVGILTFVIIFSRKEKEKAKKIDNIYSAISISNITSITGIAQTLGLSIDETKGLIEEIIKKTKNNKRDYKLLKNAYIDYSKNEVILNPKANYNVLNKTIDYVIEGFALKKKIKKDWICKHCNTLNNTKFYNCHSCGANRREVK